MTLRQLLYVVRLVETPHFKHAAEESNVSQSTLSTQLKQLEDHLGVKLFDRSTRTVKPTAIGRQIAAHAHTILQVAEDIRRIARDADPAAATIRLGVIPTLGPYYLPHALTALCGALPKMTFSLREEMTDMLIERMEEGALDAALLALPAAGGLIEKPLFDEPFYAALPDKHPLTRKKKVKPEDLKQEAMLLLDEGHCLRDQVLEFCGPSYRKLPTVRATSLETIRHMVAMNMGVSVLPELATGVKTSPKIGGVKTLPFANGSPHRTIGLVWRRGNTLDPTLQRIAETLRKSPPKGVRLARNIARED